jgi:hypothetical protein
MALTTARITERRTLFIVSVLTSIKIRILADSYNP